MANRHGVALKTGISTGTSAKTLLQVVAAANHGVRITEVAIGFHGVNATHEPILVELLRQTTAGTMSSLTPVKGDDGVSDTLDTTAQHTATAEPTAGDILRAWTVHPQTGLVYIAPPGAPITAPAAGRIGLRVTAANSVNADCYVAFEE